MNILRYAPRQKTALLLSGLILSMATPAYASEQPLRSSEHANPAPIAMAPALPGVQQLDLQNRERYRQAQRRGERANRSEQRYRENRRAQNYRDNRYRNNRTNYRRSASSSWNRGWRRNQRYNWNDYRRSNPRLYRRSTYYAPYRNYNYRRFSVGFQIGAPFYHQRYWINNPAYYRLPPVHSHYRWVRYYDDVLLVNIRSGHISDIVFGFYF